ncbi:SRPBCC domain-containing protein [Psychromicrobium lacuslunae]|uniref:Activator of Hsp90 ATPase homologue 1/2-like C-terminal domain-containing protein n=1 Tax=Psychromicrobium lacuslunae TaxID=1618207 RepID=A0A0D4BWK5_9MICC|nr:SRPBCC domain-containing protein [Psychromicrobium lacuslunae]AJT40699.1 hypothetical protein UM93_02710 [Psychromicrobium lacuslunae]
MATHSIGTIQTEGETKWLVLERQLSGSKEATWRAITDPALLDRFIGRWEGDPSSGEVSFFMTAEGSTEASTYRVLECSPTEKLIVESDFMGTVWHLQLTVQDNGGASSLRFAQRIDDGITLSDVGPGWEYYLDRLVAVESGESVDSIVWDDYYPSAAYQALQG